MNICFVMADGYKELEKPFAEFAKSRGLLGIEGHRSVGGFRAQPIMLFLLRALRHL